MNPHTASRVLPLLVILLVIFASQGSAQSDGDFSNSFVVGREYFVLRSGNAKLILQSDKSGTQPAVTYMLFDANKPCQTLRKARAFNYTPGKACSSSALEVIMRGVPFTALGHTTGVHWSFHDGIPAVEARWWAGGIRVTESFMALEGSNTFVRKITLAGKDMAGPDTVRLRLSLPPGEFFVRPSMLVGIAENVAFGIGFVGQASAVVNEGHGYIESPPIPIAQGGQVEVTTLLTTRIPAAGYSYEQDCGEDRPLSPALLRTRGQTGDLMGLTGEYFNNLELDGAPAVVRVDTNFCPYWGIASSAEGVRADSFSGRWTGSLLPSRAGRYRFSLVADERARLYIGDTLLINCWENSRNVQRTGDIVLSPGRAYGIRIEFADLQGRAGVRVRCFVPGPAPEESDVKAGVRQIFEALAELGRSRMEREIRETREHWDRTVSIVAQDSLIRDLFDHTRFSLPGMIGANGKMDASMFEYGDQWVRDGSNVALGLIYTGHFESARALLGLILTELVSSEGTMIASGAFDNPDREEFDQMGELMHALKAYRDWTGDSLLISEHRTKILTMIERPLQDRFRDSTRMVHNRREYWERTFEDGYELAYQTLMVSGLRDAADLARHLGVPEKAPFWRSEAEVFRNAMLNHPSRSLVDQGALIKRRSVDGSVANFVPGQPLDHRRDDPASTEAYHRLNPDASSVLPIVLRVVDPRSALARNTLDRLEEIWNARWETGGYERYHSSSQQDQPGPWTFATASIARAQHDAGLYDRSRRALDWLLHVQGGNAGAWNEQIPLIRTQIPGAGIIPWTTAEVTLFVVRHWLGLSFEGSDLAIRPALFPGEGGCKADLRFRSSRIRLEIAKAGAVSYAIVNGRKMFPRRDGSILIPAGELTGGLEIKVY